MHHSPKETAVLAHLRCCTVATVADLYTALGVSRMTVFRALRQHGYFTSFNHNGAFYVLADTPRFDSDGLWWHGRVGFSRHRTLQATVLALIERSPSGCTVAELQQRLATPVANLLCRLAAQGLIGRLSLGRQTLYLAADPNGQARQCASREQLALSPSPAQPPGLPADLPSTALIELLVQLIRTPTASPASLAQTLQARGHRLDADTVRSVFDCYELKKKSARWPCPNSSAN
jgi:hypothetical protein